jgi:CysZ protein
LALVVGSIFLIPAVSSLIAGLYVDDIAAEVERTAYPQDPPGKELATLPAIGLALKFFIVVLAVNIVALFLLLVPGINLIAFYLGNGYLLGREYFELAAMRHLPLAEARQLRKANRITVLLCGLIIAGIASIPILNLITPLFATAFMVRIYKGLSRPASRRAAARPAPRPAVRDRPLFGLRQTVRIRGQLQRLARRERREVMSRPSMRTAGHRAAAIRFLLGSLSAPSSRRILALSTAYPCRSLSITTDDSWSSTATWSLGPWASLPARARTGQATALHSRTPQAPQSCPEHERLRLAPHGQVMQLTRFGRGIILLSSRLAGHTALRNHDDVVTGAAPA